MSKYNRTYHLPWSLGATSDDKIAHDTSNLIGREIIISEKLDGENCAFTNGGVYARSHAEFTKSPWSKEVRQIHSVKVKGLLEEDTYIFGENMEGIHSIQYPKLDSYFYMFGVRKGDVWLSWKEVEEYSFLLDLPIVPVLFKGIVNSEKELKDITLSLCNGKSYYGDTIEGIVVRVADQFNDIDFSLKLQKWVRKDHVQTDEHWTRNWKKAKLKNKYE